MANKSYFLLSSAIVYGLFYSQNIYAANKEQSWADCIAARDSWNAFTGSPQSSWCTESSSTAPTGFVTLTYYNGLPSKDFFYDKLCAIPTERYNPETHVCKSMPDCGTFNLSGNSGSTGYQTSTACMPQGASACWYEGFPYDTSNSSLPVCSDTGGCTGSTCGTGSTGDTSNTGDTGDTSNTGDTGGTGTGVTGGTGTGTGTGSTGTDTGTGNTGCIGSGCVSGDGTGNTGNTGSTGNSGNSDNTGDTYGTGSTGNSGSTGDTSGTGCSGSTCDTMKWSNKAGHFQRHIIMSAEVKNEQNR
ncbi:hypothetical protein KFZ76_08570 [Methylovulum psychrotolerans]|uniref:hypothetical protein n=1 Tax=Methylovulum psychrotolerans TaxID=1704499 RepID=UPI001BFF5836|nr:hypothetical protein [Methylovulum psychrotolerans]MBT9097759.1 hypothetical protein [Methylovulum psychrotolerans]